MIKVTIVVSLALGVASLLRHRPAALRHWVIAVGLACAAVTPALERIVPAWDVVPAADEPGSLTPLPPLESDAALPTPPAPQPWTAPDILRAVWWAGALASALILSAGVLRMRHLTARCRDKSAEWGAILERRATHFGIRRTVALLQSEQPSLLVTWGLFRPRIVLPSTASAWNDDRIAIVLSHELAHIKRGDWIVQVLAELVRCVYWFNPLVWIACARLRHESERACDDAVLNRGVEPATYAAELVDLARLFRAHRRTWIPVSVAPAMARPSHFEKRVRAMLNSGLNRRPVTVRAGAAALAALLACTLSIAGFAGQSAPAAFSGSLLDMHGRLLPDHAMALVNAATGARYETRSDATAHFEFSGVEPGDYELHATVPGFRSRYRVMLKPGQQLLTDVTLQIGTIQETITVTGPPSDEPRRQPKPPVDVLAALPPTRCPPSSAVGGCVEQPMKLRDVRPVFPASGAGRSVTVLLRGTIGTDGWVKDAQLTAPADQDFAAAAIEAVNEWQFTPTRLNGITVETPLHVTVNFKP